MRIYLAAPLTTGDRQANLARAMAAAVELMDLGFAPYCPHLMVFLNEAHPREEAPWIRVGLAFLPICLAVLRLDGESLGADRECQEARRLGIPVFRGVASLCAWAREQDLSLELEGGLL